MLSSAGTVHGPSGLLDMRYRVVNDSENSEYTMYHQSPPQEKTSGHSCVMYRRGSQNGSVCCQVISPWTHTAR